VRRPVPALPVLAALALLVCGCENVRHDYMPFAVGNRWEYRQFVREGGGERELARRRVELVRRLDRLTYAEAGEGRYWLKRGGFIACEHRRSATRVHLLMLPAHTGYGWWWLDAAGGGRYWCTIAGRETVRIPAGSFRECVRVEMKPAGAGPVLVYWFAPDVGIVRYAERDARGRESFRYELAAWELAGEPDPRLGLDDIETRPAGPGLPPGPLPPDGGDTLEPGADLGGERCRTS